MLIQLQQVGKTYPMPGEDVQALRSFDAEFDRGEFVSIVGSSGSGKTTLLYLLGMLTEPTSGTYRFDGQDVASLSDVARSKLRGQGIGFVFQAFHLLPQVSVLGNVKLASRYAGNRASPDAVHDRAVALLERVGLGHRMGHRSRQLSGGEMQRVAIARALLNDPRLILADEPTGNLDEKNGEQVFQLLRELADEGKTVIVVTHDLDFARRVPRQIALKDGEVLDDAVALA